MLTFIGAITVASVTAGCSEQPDPIFAPAGTDPVVARALNDPLMVDPDLAYRNEANAALTIGFDHALPPLEATELSARLAREEARMILREVGLVKDLPDLSGGATGPSLGAVRGNAVAMAESYSIAARCVDQLAAGYEWAARMPEIVELMPHGQVYQAAGVSSDGCQVRLVRYFSPAAAEDVLEWHYNLADRANLNIELEAQPEPVMRAEKRGTNAMVHTSQGPNGLTAVDVIYWVE